MDATNPADFPSALKKNRNIPKPLIWFLTLFVYGFSVPLNWLLTRGNGKPLVLRESKRVQKLLHNIVHSMDDYTPTEHDIFVNTYAKSGTNWMMQIAYQAAFLGKGEFENIYDVIPWPDMHVQMKGRYTVGLDELRMQEAAPTKRRVIKTHLAAQYVPWKEQAHYICVIRDPKDAFVSSYHFQCGIFGPLMPSVEDWLDSYFTKNFPIGFGATWAQHTASYWALRDKPNLLILSFSDMKKDLSGTVKKVTDFLGIDLTEAQLSEVIQKSEFSTMKAIDQRFFPVNTDSLPFGNISLVRSGKEGASGELLSPQQQRHIDTRFIAELKALDSDFPYEEFCRVSY